MEKYNETLTREEFLSAMDLLFKELNSTEKSIVLGKFCHINFLLGYLFYLIDIIKEIKRKKPCWTQIKNILFQ